MDENQTGQSNQSDTRPTQGESSQESLKQKSNAKGKTEKAKKPDNETPKKKREGLREFLRRWEVLLQLIIPSIFSLGVLIVIAVQAVIYSRQLEQMRVSTDANTRAADAATSAANSARQSVEISQKNLDLIAKSIDITQRSTELSQRNVELAQKSLDATREAIGYASKQNAISERTMEAATTPWIDVRIQQIKPLSDKMMQIKWTMENHSDSPAPSTLSECFIQNTIDQNGFGAGSNLAVLAHQTINMTSDILVPGQNTKTLIQQITQGKMPIKIMVLSSKKSSIIETFYWLNGDFTVTDQKFNPSRKDILKLLNDSYPKDKKR
jgi:hypothetical protein